MSGTDCAVCKIIRTYLLFAVPLLALVGASTMDGGISSVPWFARVEIIDLLSWGCLAALIAIVSYRAYQESVRCFFPFEAPLFDHHRRAGWPEEPAARELY